MSRVVILDPRYRLEAELPVGTISIAYGLRTTGRFWWKRREEVWVVVAVTLEFRPGAGLCRAWSQIKAFDDLEEAEQFSNILRGMQS